MALLEAMVYDARTRIGHESIIFYNLGVIKDFGRIGVSAPGVCAYQANTVTCGRSVDAFTASTFIVARTNRAIKSTVPLVITVNGVTTVTIPALCPPNIAFEFPEAVANITSVSCTGGIAGDGVDILSLPHPENDRQLCFDSGFTPAEGQIDKPIPRKFESANHYVRQRPENTISASELFVTDLAGLSLLRGRDTTLIQKFYPDGGSVPSQITYLDRCRLSASKEIPAEGNDSVTVTAEGAYNRQLIFAAAVS